MSNTAIETTRKPTWLARGNRSETKITDGHTTAYGYGYSNDVTIADKGSQKETKREQIEKFEYRKVALLNYRNDLMSKLAECADKISEIDRELRTISGTHGENKN